MNFKEFLKSITLFLGIRYVKKFFISILILYLCHWHKNNRLILNNFFKNIELGPSLAFSCEIFVRQIWYFDGKSKLLCKKMNKVGLTGQEQWILLSENSRKIYEKSWSDFSKFLSSNDARYKPCVEDYLTYFDFLKNAKNHKGSTIWSVFSQLNHVHFKLFNEKLNDSRLTDMLKV